jgi:hypothetical protein
MARLATAGDMGRTSQRDLTKRIRVSAHARFFCGSIEAGGSDEECQANQE